MLGERKAIGRAISIVESGEVSARALLRALEPHLGHALVIGVTGPPGAGKSTLVGILISQLLEQRVAVGALLVDPSSPRTKGAILGDRMRFVRGSMRGTLFTRSLASRGHLGGLTDTLSAVIDVLDAAKFPVIIVEAVGGGQADVEINDVADLTLVLSPPGLGDDVQAIKAGVLEIADFIVVTKCDRPGAEAARQQMALMVSHSSVPGESRKVLAVSSMTGEGVGELMDEIFFRLRAEPLRSTERRRRSELSIRRRIADLAARLVREQALEPNDPDSMAICARVAAGELELESAVECLLVARLHRLRRRRTVDAE